MTKKSRVSTANLQAIRHVLRSENWIIVMVQGEYGAVQERISSRHGRRAWRENWPWESRDAGRALYSVHKHDSDWIALIYALGTSSGEAHEVAGKDAMALSRALEGRVLSFVGSDVTGTMEYRLLQDGKVVDRVSLAQATGPVTGSKRHKKSATELVDGPQYMASSAARSTPARPPKHTHRESSLAHTQYDAAGRHVVTRYADGSEEIAAYDAEGRATSRTDRGGRTRTMAYDVRARMTGVTFDGASTTYGYDAAGRRTTRTDRRGHATTSTFDAAGRLVPEAVGPTVPRSCSSAAIDHAYSMGDQLHQPPRRHTHAGATTPDPQFRASRVPRIYAALDVRGRLARECRDCL